MKQAGDKLAPGELNQLNEILKAQFRQMFPANPSPSPNAVPALSTNQMPQPVGASQSQAAKRKTPGSAPNAAAAVVTASNVGSNLKAAMDDLKKLQVDRCSLIGRFRRFSDFRLAVAGRSKDASGCEWPNEGRTEH